MEDPINSGWESWQLVVIERCKQAYEWAVQAGIAKEQARAVLPEGLTMTRMYVNGTLRSWIHYIQLRAAEGTQKEHREIAKAVGDVIYQIFPLDDVF
jgi:thymidylate synthase (FAD)